MRVSVNFEIQYAHVIQVDWPKFVAINHSTQIIMPKKVIDVVQKLGLESVLSFEDVFLTLSCAK